MEDIYENVESTKSVKTDNKPSTTEPGPRSSETSCYGPVVLSLVLLSVLLLAGVIGLGVRLTSEAAELSTVKARLTDLTEERDQLKANVSALTEDRDQLKANVSAPTEERDQLKANVSALTEDRDQLQELLRQKKTCPAGWMMSSSSCYFLSTQSGSWTEGRDECRARGADLLVIDSAEEQTFVSGLTEAAAWIGLSDRDAEGIWEWIDGAPLAATFWGEKQPDNAGSAVEEDCGHIRAVTAQWNDLNCEKSLQWICEKAA